jgi:hypothetical protein
MATELVALKEKNQELQEQIDKQKQKDVNHTANQPSGKKPEWDKDGPKGGSGKNGGKRNGSGNKTKKDLVPDAHNHIGLTFCPHCNKDLTNEPVVDTNSRIVEDIEEPPKKTVVIEETTERKYCSNCKEVVSVKSELALPGSDIGLNALMLMIYFWVVPAMSLPNIRQFFHAFWRLTISTAGISKIMIRVALILAPVAEEIRKEVKSGSRVWADETGWRVKGVTWWLWAFANETAAFYFAVPSRGSEVVLQVLGDFFWGVLITDGWAAYNLLICLERQTCMAHIYRKIKRTIKEYPELRSVLKFYTRLRRIIKDGEWLRDHRETISRKEFLRRYKRLCRRLERLLRWPNPNEVLAKIIKSIRKQQSRVLTFVKHPGLPNHNNYGEYIIRKGVLKRKISGGSMSSRGAEAYAVLISIAQTCHLRKLSFTAFLKVSLLQYIRTGKPMLLSEYEKQLQDEQKAA